MGRCPDDEPVRLTWTDRDELEIAEGRRNDGYAILPQYRAEALTHWILGEHGDRFELRIDPWTLTKETSTVLTLAFWLGLAEAALGFLARFKVLWGLGLVVILAVLSIYLPTAHLRVYPTVAALVVSFGAGFLLPRPSDSS